MNMNAEDEAIFALLDTPVRDADNELDALLDQVLEFAGNDEPSSPAIQPVGLQGELVPEALLQIAPVSDLKTKPGDTLTRIRSLLPPPPEGGEGSSQARPSPPAPRRGPPPPPPLGKLPKKR
jgi:hypothetical protein